MNLAFAAQDIPISRCPDRSLARAGTGFLR